MSREDALHRLALLADLINPNPEDVSAFSTDEIAELQNILTDHNYTVRSLMILVGPALTFPSLRP
jgi:hypothetical protein